jgi:hypothetical protein
MAGEDFLNLLNNRFINHIFIKILKTIYGLSMLWNIHVRVVLAHFVKKQSNVL